MERSGRARALRVLVAAAAAACASAAATGGAGTLPGPLHRLVLVEEHPQIPPVVFDHARHADPRAMGRAVACADCHHTLRDGPDRVPEPCTACHGFAYERPPVDESLPHDHSLPPDL